MTQPMSARALMDKLVSFPTVSRDSNLPLIDWVQEYLESQGIVSHRKYDESGDKAALFAHVGPDQAGGVVLSGHTDCGNRKRRPSIRAWNLRYEGL